ncbi:hypothetical protein CRUP_034681, partial [Coryphaenoides rupestris]
MSKLSVSSMVHSARKRIRRHRRVDESPLSNDVLNSILLYLFPDAAVEKSSSAAVPDNSDGRSEHDSDYNLFNQLKSAPSDSLTYRLALCVCLVNFYHGGVRALAHLWQEFVLEMRYRWENNYLVYGARKRIRRHRRVDESPLSNDVLNSILLYLFPDAAVEKSSSPSSSSAAATVPDNSDGRAVAGNASSRSEHNKDSDYNLFNQLKSAPSDSLTYRLALCVCLVNFYHDLRCCLLHQKLQMLNCCIKRKRARDETRKASDGSRERPVSGSSKNGCRGRENSAGAPPPTGGGAEGGAGAAREASPGKSWDSWSDSEDEFFECLSDQEEAAAAKDGDAERGSRAKPPDGRLHSPDGRLHPHGKMTLLHSSTEPLYIPITQRAISGPPYKRLQEPFKSGQRTYGSCCRASVGAVGRQLMRLSPSL